MGVACVSTRSDGTLDTVADGETGLVFQGGDAEGLARSVESLLTDERLRERIAEHGRRQARERFNLDGMTDRVEALYAASLAPPA